MSRTDIEARDWLGDAGVQQGCGSPESRGRRVVSVKGCWMQYGCRLEASLADRRRQMEELQVNGARRRDG